MIYKMHDYTLYNAIYTARNHFKLTEAAEKVYKALLIFCDKNGNVVTTAKKMCQLERITVNTVTNGYRELQSHGIIKRLKTGCKESSGSVYKVNCIVAWHKKHIESTVSNKAVNVVVNKESSSYIKKEDPSMINKEYTDTFQVSVDNISTGDNSLLDYNKVNEYFKLDYKAKAIGLKTYILDVVSTECNVKFTTLKPIVFNKFISLLRANKTSLDTHIALNNFIKELISSLKLSIQSQTSVPSVTEFEHVSKAGITDDDIKELKNEIIADKISKYLNIEIPLSSIDILLKDEELRAIPSLINSYAYNFSQLK